MRGFLLWFGDAFAHAMGALSWEDKKTIPPSIGMQPYTCLLYTSPSPRDRQKSRMPSSA